MLITLGLAIGGCQCEPVDAHDQRYACNADDQCAAGFSCIEGLCQTPGADAGTGGGAVGGGDAQGGGTAIGAGGGAAEEDDAGTDAGFDDAGTDAGTDAGFDAGPIDAGYDAGYPDGGPGVWFACKTAMPLLPNAPAAGWNGVPGFLLPHTAAVVLPDAPSVPRDDADSSAIVKTAWDDAQLYVQLSVRDDRVLPDNPAKSPYNNDGIEVTIDAMHTRTSTYDAGQYQFNVCVGNRVETLHMAPGPFDHVVASEPGGFRINYAIPWSTLGPHGTVLGIDFAVDDNDDAGLRKSQLVWKGDGGAWRDPTNMGELRLLTSPCGPP